MNTVHDVEIHDWQERADQYFGTGPNMGRGKAQESLDLLAAAGKFLEDAHPATVRGVCYRLFVDDVIESMARKETKRVSRLLVDAREAGMIPWEWIVDEHRSVERRPSWSDPAEYVHAVRRSYRRDFWDDQPHRVEVWSEKGTVRGVLRPVIEDYGVGFLSVGGFNSATMVQDAATRGTPDQPLVVLYVGDYDPSGLYMSERDLPGRLEKYGGDDVVVRRVALLADHLHDLPSFPASDKKKDSRYKWFTREYGADCWELDAMHPNNLRDVVRAAIEAEIEPEAWRRCEAAQEAEQESLEALLATWKGAA